MYLRKQRQDGLLIYNTMHLVHPNGTQVIMYCPGGYSNMTGFKRREFPPSPIRIGLHAWIPAGPNQQLER